MNILYLLDKDPLSYVEVDRAQREIHAVMARGEEPDTLIVWQAKDAYTAGRRTRPEGAPDPSVPVIKVNCGSSVTYYGPGQVTVHPVVRAHLPKDVVAFVRVVKAAVIEALSASGVCDKRITGYSGVWVNGEKTCAIRLKFASDAIIHGLALSVMTGVLKFFRVNPCRITNAGIISMERQGVDVSLEEAAATLTSIFDRHPMNSQQER